MIFPFKKQLRNQKKNKTMPDEEISNERKPKQGLSGEQAGWKRWLNYQSIVKQLPFFLFLALLAVLYIYNGHYADKTIRNISRTAREVKELQYEHISIKGEVIFRSKQSEMIKAVEPMGLKELTASPAVLKYNAANEESQ